MRIALSVATAALLVVMAGPANAQADPHHPEGAEVAPTETAPGFAGGCPAITGDATRGMPRPESGSSASMEMTRMMQMMQHMQMMQMMQMQLLIQQMQKDPMPKSEAVE